MRKSSVSILSIFISAWVMGLAGAPKASYASVELHAHLFMKEGMSWLFSGGFFDELHATSWKDRFRSKANPASVRDSGIQVLVATLYVHPFLTLSVRDSVRRQIDQAERFVKENPEWIIARDGEEAEKALAQGKRVLVLALEGASGIIESEEDLREFVDQRGIRIVTLLHLVDDHFGGVAFLRGFRAFANPWGFLTQLFDRRENGVLTNDRGLTIEGEELAKQLIRRGVWIDLAHASDQSQEKIVPLMKSAGHPLLYTHTVLRKYHRAERAITAEQLQAVADTGGIVGVMPSQEMLDGTELPADSPCPAGLSALVAQYNEIAQIVGPSSIGLGSDYNGGLPHLPPGCAHGTSLEEKGLWNIGQAAELWKAMEAAGARVPQPLSLSVERFVDAWKHVKPTPDAAPAATE